MTWSSIWADLTADERRAAAQAHPISRAPLPADAEVVVDALAAHLNMRARSVKQLEPEKRVAYLAKAPALHVAAARALLIALHHGPRLALMTRFFDACGLAHERGQVSEHAGDTPLPPQALSRGLAALGGEPPRDVSVLLDCLEATNMRLWSGLAVARAAPGPRQAPEAAPDPAEDARLAAPSARGLTLLDHALIDAAVASASEQHGALAPEQVRDLVEEVVDLNSKRTQSRFVLGFLDVLQGREPVPGGPEANAERRGWYLAGALSGLARRGDHAAVVGLARSQPEIVRSLLQPEAPALELVAGLLFDAHAAVGSLGELLRLLGVPAVLAAWDSLAERMLREATRLLRIYRPDEAFSLLMLLYGAVQRWDRADPPPDKFRADLDRRRAHALRLRGDMEGARKILYDLLKRGAGVHASRAHADLGLIASGHKALAHVEVPRDAAEWGGKAKALRRGLEHFEASVFEPEPGGAHGDYCLGVLHLCERAYAKARPYLERAVAEMQANEGVYAPLGTLARARLYLGVCLADSMDLARSGHAVELLAQGVRALGADVPMPLLLHAFEALGTTDPARVATLVDDLRGPLGDQLLEAVRAADRLHEHPELLARLVERMGDEGRPRRERIHDAEVVLAAALKAGRPETGAEALDVLEHLADDREQRQRLLALLESRERYDPAWSHAEAIMARASLLEADARYAEAQALLEEAAHEQLGQEGERAVPFASAIVERIREHGRGAASEALQRRVAALAPAPPPRAAGARPAIPRGRVLFLGGDERQKQYDERLLAELRGAYPEVELDIEHTGWSSNWGRWLVGIETRIRAADAVVLMQFMRTLFGRHVRETCSRFDKPWYPCTGHGFASLKRSIEQAIQRLPAAT